MIDSRELRTDTAAGKKCKLSGLRYSTIEPASRKSIPKLGRAREQH